MSGLAGMPGAAGIPDPAGLPGPATPAPGLRESKRLELERELARIALRLVAERGLASVTVDDIVREARVSRRTFSNYYPCKEAAVAAVIGHLGQAALDTWTPSAAATTPLTAVRDLVAHQVESGTVRTLAQVVALAREHPTLVPFVREAQWSTWQHAGERVLAWLPAPREVERRRVQVAMGAVFAALSAFLGDVGPTSNATSTAARRLLDAVLDDLEQGLG